MSSYVYTQHLYQFEHFLFALNSVLLLQEIIQNADDARATEVKFFIDCREMETLQPELVSTRTNWKQFTGPALLSYNDAPFTKEDWESIQSLQRSVKEKNPHKVGKFGIGFNSVYHITGKRRQRE